MDFIGCDSRQVQVCGLPIVKLKILCWLAAAGFVMPEDQNGPWREKSGWIFADSGGSQPNSELSNGNWAGQSQRNTDGLDKKTSILVMNRYRDCFRGHFS